MLPFASKFGGTVVRQIQLEPEQVTFGEIAAGEDVNFEVRIYSYLDEKISSRQTSSSLMKKSTR